MEVPLTLFPVDPYASGGRGERWSRGIGIALTASAYLVPYILVLLLALMLHPWFASGLLVIVTTDSARIDAIQRLVGFMLDGTYRPASGVRNGLPVLQLVPTIEAEPAVGPTVRGALAGDAASRRRVRLRRRS